MRGKILFYLGLLSIWAGGLLLLVKGGGRNLWYSLPLILYGIIAVIIHFYLMRSIGKRAYKKLTEYHDPMQEEINEENISLTIGENKSVIPWSDFKKVLISDEMILLYPRDTVFFIFPRKNFAGNDFEEFPKLVKEKVEKVF